MQIKIEKLIYGGAGLARTEEGVVFVHRTAPGDVLEVELVERKKDYANARIIKLLEPSADRQTPTCPNYQNAGCCHWQHIQYARQVEYKDAILRETLQRAGRITWEKDIAHITGPDLAYRLRASFHVRDHRLGFVRARSSVVVPIDECSALVPELNDWIPEANKIIVNETEVDAVAAAGGPVASTLKPSAPARLEVNGFIYDVHPDAFFQSNRFLLDAFMNEVLDQAGAAPKYVLDLYCGSGFFSMPLAKRSTELIGLEASRTAVKAARRNAKLNEISNAEFYEGNVDATLKDADIRPDLVVLNPPRTGCGKDTAAKIAELYAPRVVYVSCNPSTFAREATAFLAKGYQLDRITLIDQFPNTYHIEMAAEFALR